jgi:phage terminase Nu1 subunit (DNA packaging protein)
MAAGKLVNRAELSELCGVSVVTIDNWVRDGAPFVRRPVRKGVGQWEFAAGAVFQWRLDRERQSALGDLAQVDEAEARRRKLAAEAGLAELDLQLKNGGAVAVADQERVWVQMVGAARARLLSIPTKLGPTIAIENDPILCQSLIQGAMVEALMELSGFDPEALEEESFTEESVDGKLIGFAEIVTKIRNIAASGGEERFASIIRECDRLRRELFGLPVDAGGNQQPSIDDSQGSGPVGSAAKPHHKRVGRPGKKTQSGK